MGRSYSPGEVHSETGTAVLAMSMVQFFTRVLVQISFSLDALKTPVFLVWCAQHSELQEKLLVPVILRDSHGLAPAGNTLFLLMHF